MVGNGWVYLGEYYFNAGSNPASGSVIISNQRSSPDGTYAFGCPTLWSASEGGATLSARAASGLLGVIGNQRLSLSTDGACSFNEVPATGGRQAFDVAAGTDAIWFLERGGADPAESRLGRATDCTDSRIVGPWTDTLPDTVREGACGSDRCLFVSGARPTPSLWFTPVAALSAAMEQGANTDALWQQIPLPADLAPQRLAVRAAAGGLRWVAITSDGISSPPSTATMSGTSMAAPHAAGHRATATSQPAGG
jgi:subtilisin family serine protease